MRRDYNVGGGGTIDLSMVDVNGSKLSARYTANCYVVKKAGAYMFPCVYGPGIINGSVNTTCYNNNKCKNYLGNRISNVYINTDTGQTISSASTRFVSSFSDFVISNVQLISVDNMPFVYFEVTTFPTLNGNATIDIKDSSNRIMWSWHIWAYSDNINVFSYSKDYTTYRWMGVPLGLYSTGNSTITYSMCYYQYAKKDPVVYVDSLKSGSFTISGSYATSMADVIKNPNYIYRGNNMTYWFATSDNDLSSFPSGAWVYANKKMVFDPSPVHYMAGSVSAMDGWSVRQTSVNKAGYTINGYFFPQTDGFDVTSSISTFSLSTRVGATLNGNGQYYSGDFKSNAYSYSQCEGIQVSKSGNNAITKYTRALSFSYSAHALIPIYNASIC